MLAIGICFSWWSLIIAFVAGFVVGVAVMVFDNRRDRSQKPARIKITDGDAQTGKEDGLTLQEQMALVRGFIEPVGDEDLVLDETPLPEEFLRRHEVPAPEGIDIFDPEDLEIEQADPMARPKPPEATKP